MPHDALPTEFPYTVDRPADPLLCSDLRAFVATRGIVPAAKVLKVGRETLTRTIAGLPVKHTTSEHLARALPLAMGVVPLSDDERADLQTRIAKVGVAKLSEALSVGESILFRAAGGQPLPKALRAVLTAK